MQILFQMVGNITNNDTLYYRLGNNRYLREDTIEKKVWYRQYFTYPEELYYDFSMEVGDSINYSFTTPDYYLKLYNKQVENIFGVDRTVYYLKWYENGTYVIWIEGIGSLGGILNPNAPPSLSLLGDTELNCYYHNDEMLYQSEIASIYGCHFEIDPYPPYIDCVWASPDTVALNEKIEFVVIVYDQTSLTITETYTSPNNNEYSVSNFLNVPDYYPEYWYTLFSDFNDEIGDWYLSKIHIEDEQNNITEENYTFENSPAKFYVTKAIGINEQINNDNFSIYPNPIINNLFVKANNIINSEYNIEICDIFGKIIYQKNIITERTQIDMSAYKSGIYFIKINNENNQTIYNNKFIK